MRRAVALLLFCVACGTSAPTPAPTRVTAQRTPQPPPAGAVPPGAVPPEEWLHWREQRRESLAGENGWLTLIGLWWLTPGGGEMRAGSDPHAHVHLPPSAPGYLGELQIVSGKVHFVAGTNAVVTRDGVRVTELDIETDASEHPTVLACGTLRIFAIERSHRLGVRIKDSASPARQGFAGVPVYDYDPRWRVRAHVVAPHPPRHLSIVNVLGMSEDEPCVGVLHFTLDGVEHTLAATAGGTRPEDGLSVMIRDATSDVETYGAGRYIDLPPPDATGDVWLDFNFLYTPPCAFTSFATCPLPPDENVLPIAIRAGERYVHHE